MAAIAALVTTCIGCTEPPERLNAPPQGKTERPNVMQDQYIYMHDNAMVTEMSMSPAHFVPHSSELNSLGARRLCRYADMFKECGGGTLHYDGFDDPETLGHDRREQIKAFLVSAGVAPGTFEVEPGLAGGRMLRADEAGKIRDFTSFSVQQQEREDKGETWRQGSLDDR
ncbi:MAG: hypothetical protein AMXMBFR13_09180 [Phycisphaerae bacterium]